MFQMIHAMHLAGRCTGCGECERACPVNIPVLLFQATARHRHTRYLRLRSRESTRKLFRRSRPSRLKKTQSKRGNCNGTKSIHFPRSHTRLAGKAGRRSYCLRSAGYQRDSGFPPVRPVSAPVSQRRERLFRQGSRLPAEPAAPAVCGQKERRRQTHRDSGRGQRRPRAGIRHAPLRRTRFPHLRQGFSTANACATRTT